MVMCMTVINPGFSEASSGDTEKDEELEAEKRKRRRRVKRRKAAAAGPSVFWKNCHSCKRQLEIETTANQGARVQYVKCSLCPLRFCDVCLLRKHGEDAEEEMEENVRWVCPICRGGCGPGCTISCCTCGPCRKLYKQLEPAGRMNLPANFSNVHDYLIHFETGESAEVIASRKMGRGWTKATGGLAVDLNLTWAMKRMRSVRCRPALIQRVLSKSSSQEVDKDEKPVEGSMVPKQAEILKRSKRPSIRLTSYLME